MKAVRIHRHGPPEVLVCEEVEPPRPGPGEVAVALKAASVNHIDIWLRRELPTTFPRIPGADGAGVVEGLGPGVEGVKVGDRVFIDPGAGCGRCAECAADEPSLCRDYSILGEHRDGTYAERVCVPASGAMAMPEGADFTTAAAAPLVYLTAWRMLTTRARLKAGEDVLILAAGAGVGTACLQIAKHIGARVIATAGSEAKCARVAAAGADVTIDHGKEDFAARVRQITAKRGVDVVVDTVGKETWARSLRCLRKGGRLVTCGATSGHDPVEDLRHIFYRQLEILGSTMGSRREMREVMGLVFAGKLKPIVEAVLPLSEAAEAHRRIEARGVVGKIVLGIPDPPKPGAIRQDLSYNTKWP